MNWTWFHKFASPPHAYRLLGKMRPWLFWPAVILMLWALYNGLFVAPTDYQQGDSFRIMYVHVPSASMSLMVYSMMAIAAGIGIIWRMKLAHAVAIDAGILSGQSLSCQVMTRMVFENALIVACGGRAVVSGRIPRERDGKQCIGIVGRERQEFGEVGNCRRDVLQP